MQYKKRRTRLEIFEYLSKVDEELAPLRLPSKRLPDLRKPFSAYDERTLLSYVHYLKGNIRNDLTNEVPVREIRESLATVRTILSFCGRVPSGDLTPYTHD